MTYTAEKKRIGRRPFEMIRLKLDWCSNAYGVSPCTAGRASSGTATAGSSNTITLDATASGLTGVYNSHTVSIYAGTGTGQEKTITGYVGGTRVATIRGTWTIVPDATSQYVIVNRTAACYNTRATCQNSTNYAPSRTSHNYLFTTLSSDFPKSLWSVPNVALVSPCLMGIERAPTRMGLGVGLGYRAAIQVRLKDFAHHDRGTDLYTANRQYTPEEQGTFWGKFLTRNKYYQGRELVLYTGYLTETGAYDAANFQTRTYIIERIDGPDRAGNVTITAKDVLKFADDDRSQVPEPTIATLNAVLTDIQIGTVAVLDLETSKFATSGFARFGREIFAYSARTVSSITISARAQKGTTADAHKIGDNIQFCMVWDEVNVVTILQQLLDVAYQTTPGFTRNAGLATVWLDLTGWTAEKVAWLNSVNLTSVLSEPVGVRTLIEELVENCLFSIWWDELATVVRIKAVSPNQSVGTLTDQNNLLADTVAVKDDPAQRVTQVWVWYAPDDWTEKEAWNYQYLYIQLDVDAEGIDKYDETKARIIRSRWIPSAALSIQLAGRTLTLFKDNPRVIQFSLDAKDSVETGEYYTLDTQSIQNFDGSNLLMDVVILETKETMVGSTVEYLAQEYAFTGKYGVIGFDDTALVVAATPDTITFASSASSEDGVYVGHVVRIVSGTGAGQTNEVIAYTGATRVAAVITPWAVTPDGTSVYLVTLPNYSSDYLLMESGAFIILETGFFLMLESATEVGASDALKAQYSWISPESGVFSDDATCYKIT
jgi:hypothetical protein